MLTDMDVYYQYSCKYLLPAIIKSGFLALTESNFSFEQAGLFPVVWLTNSPTPDNNGLLFDDNMPDDLNKTHIRFTIRNRPYIKRWDEWSDSKGMDKNQKQLLIHTASAEDTYKNWCISEQPIPIATDVICVENLVTGQMRKF